MLKPYPVVALLALIGIAQAQEMESAVHVSAVRDPVDKSYRKILSGMDTFERFHSLAPRASLRFQLLTRKPGATLDGITVKVAGDTVTLPLQIAADKTFTVEPDQAAYDEDASMVLNRKNETVTWRAQIVSPGLPAGARRLGDLRLGCRVGVAAELVSPAPLLVRMFRTRNTDQCMERSTRYFQFAERPIFGVYLEAGARKQYLPFGEMYCGAPGLLKLGLQKYLSYTDCQALPELTYVAPLYDTSWPDDTLVRFDFMDEPDETGTVATGQAVQRRGPDKPLRVETGATTVEALRSQAEPEVSFTFASGHQVLRYQVAPAAAPAATHAKRLAELVVLADPAGVVRKLRRYEWAE